MANYRTQQMQAIAQQLGLDFSEKDEWGNLSLLEGFRLFRRGRRKKVRNLMSGKTPLGELKVQIFDYHFTISAGKTTKTKKQTVFFVQSKELSLPEFWMKPEHFFHRIGDWLGIRDIDFKEHPEFSDHYYLKGEDEELIRDTFNMYMIHFFTIERNWCLEGVGYFFILYQENELIETEAIRSFYQKGMEVLNRLKN